jgi:hypothetical protein
LLALLFLLTPSLFGQILNEENLKANYLLGFPRFVRWETPPEPPVTIGLVGAESLGDRLEELLARRLDEGKPVDFEIRLLRPGESLEGVEILYLSPSHREHWAPWIERAEGRAVLIVGQGEGFLEAGGMIELVVRRNKLKYQLNPEAAGRAGIEFSSKLFDLALDER